MSPDEMEAERLIDQIREAMYTVDPNYTPTLDEIEGLLDNERENGAEPDMGDTQYAEHKDAILGQAKRLLS